MDLISSRTIGELPAIKIDGSVKLRLIELAVSI
jgi:hypothetical protein